MYTCKISTLATLLAIIWGLASGAEAQFAHQPQDQGTAITAAAPKRRGLRWWERSRPAMTNAAEQLAFANALLEEGRLSSAARHYRILTYAWPNAPEAPMAQFKYAGILHQRGRYTKAFDEYQYLLDTYAGFFPYEKVLEEQYAIADRVATRRKRLLFIPYQDEAEAVPMFEQLLINAPRWPRAPETHLGSSQRLPL
ncbi:MAG: tol-pal system YbgF family protein, partial [Kiritimatiellia bacterium]